MKQILHIFKKDVRHQWVDLALYLGLLVILAFTIPTAWLGHWSDNDFAPLLRGLAQVVLPITWLVLITRLVHAEALVGDRQFWTTRPYRWGGLLLAKLLFLAVCIALPYLICQCALAFYGDVSPLNRGIFVDMGMHTIIVWIPMLLMAAVNSALAATFFTTLGAVIVWAAVLTWLLGDQGPIAVAPFSLPILAIVFATLFSLVLVRLYKQRRIFEGRVLLGGLAVLFLLLIVFTAKMSPGSLGTRLLEARYRSDASRYHLLYDPAIPHTAKAEVSRGFRYATLPIRLSGLAVGNGLDNTVAQFTVDTVGFHYTSPWRPASLGADGLRLMLPAAVVSRIGHADAGMSIQVAADDITPSETLTSDLRARIAIPGGGTCVAIDPPYEGRSSETAVVCRYAFGVPAPIEVVAHTNAGCSAPSFPLVRIAPRQAGTYIDPLTHVAIKPFSPRHGSLGEAKGCTVQSLTATLYRTVSHFRTSVAIPSIRLADDIDPSSNTGS